MWYLSCAKKYVLHPNDFEKLKATIAEESIDNLFASEEDEISTLKE